MSFYRKYRFSAVECICLAIFAIVSVTAETRVVYFKVCDKSKCPGPLVYYEELGCQPIYKNPGDCCAVEYNCDHVKQYSKNKCYVNGHEYNVGEALRAEDSNPCDYNCVCQQYNNQTASFICAALLDCNTYVESNCFTRFDRSKCCLGEYICLDDIEKRATCVVNGVTYKDGDLFIPNNEPNKVCSCTPDYRGINEERFCTTLNHSRFSLAFRDPDVIHNNCAPVTESPLSDVRVSPTFTVYAASRCPSENDTVIHNHDSTLPEDGKTCKFGDMIMHLGDELNEKTNCDSTCVKCVCEIPPVPTCRRLPAEQCLNSPDEALCGRGLYIYVPSPP